MADETPAPVSEAPKTSGLKMLVGDDCRGCEDAKRTFSEQIRTGEITLVDVKSDEGKRALASGIDVIPTVYRELPAGGTDTSAAQPQVQVCNFKDEGDHTVIECSEPDDPADAPPRRVVDVKDPPPA